MLARPARPWTLSVSYVHRSIRPFGGAAVRPVAWRAESEWQNTTTQKMMKKDITPVWTVGPQGDQQGGPHRDPFLASPSACSWSSSSCLILLIRKGKMATGRATIRASQPVTHSSTSAVKESVATDSAAPTTTSNRGLIPYPCRGRRGREELALRCVGSRRVEPTTTSTTATTAEAANLTDKLTGPVEKRRRRPGEAEEHCRYSMKSTVSDETIAATIRVIRSFVLSHACSVVGALNQLRSSSETDATCTSIVAAVIARLFHHLEWPACITCSTMITTNGSVRFGNIAKLLRGVLQISSRGIPRGDSQEDSRRDARIDYLKVEVLLDFVLGHFIHFSVQAR